MRITAELFQPCRISFRDETDAVLYRYSNFYLATLLLYFLLNRKQILRNKELLQYILGQILDRKSIFVKDRNEIVSHCT